MAEQLRGKPVADALVADARLRADALRDGGVIPTLAIVRVGEDPGDLSYERTILKRAEAAGVAVEVRALAADASQDEVVSAIEAVNADAGVHGCLLFRPLPKHLDEAAICELLDPAKDIDGITRASLEAVFAGDVAVGCLAGTGAGGTNSAACEASGAKLPGKTAHRGRFSPSTAEACVRLLDYYHVPLEGARVAVVGRSLVVGKPLAMLLMARNATVTVCHSRTRDLAEECRRADVVVCATGRARAFGAEYFRSGQAVLDVGINFDESGTMCGDADAAALEALDVAYTPVPGGIGSVTTAVTLSHVVEAAEASLLYNPSTSSSRG